MTFTARSDLINREFSDQQRATMGSFVSFGGSIGFGLVAALIGFIADLTGPIPAMLATLSVHFIIIYIYWIVFRKKRHA